MHPTQKTIDMLRIVAERINKLTARKQFEDEIFNPPLPPKVAKTIHNKRGSVKPKGNKIRKRPVDKHGSHDQSTHSPTGSRGKKDKVPAGRNRAARVLDLTHAIGERGPKTYQARQRVASALDRGVSPRKKDVDWLESVAHRAGGVKPLRIRQERQDRMTADNPNYPPKRQRGPYSRKVTKGDIVKHPGHPDQRVHGRRRLAATAAAGAAGAVAGRAAASAVRGLAVTAAAGRAVSGLSRTVERLNPKAARKFKRLARRGLKTLRRHKAKLARRLAPAAKAGLRLASRARVPGAIGIGLMAAAAAYGLVRQRTQKVQKAGNLTSGDHVLVLTGDEAIVGVYTGKETVRVLTNDSYIDIKPPKNDVLLIQRGNTVPDENSDSSEIAALADTLSRERQVMGRLSEKVKNGKVSKRSVGKHAMGQHDQSSHGNRATRVVRNVRAKARRAGRRVQTGIRQAGQALHATAETTRSVANDLDSVLQGLEAGTRIYDKVKSLRDTLTGESEKMMKAEMTSKELAESKRLAERLKGKESIDNPHALARWQVQHKKFVENTMEKGIRHSLDILTNAMKLIRGQEADAKLSEADEKKLQDIIDDIQGMVGYLEKVKKQGYFEKGEPAVPDSRATYRPSFTTPAVAREQKRQRTEPNAKGRGESTARAPGY